MNQIKKERTKEMAFLMILGLLILPLILFLSVNKPNVGKAFAMPYLGENVNKVGNILDTSWFLYFFIAFILVIAVAGISYVVHEERKIKKIFKRERHTSNIYKEPDKNNITIDSGLDKYVYTATKRGYTRENINDALIKAGWSQLSINNAFEKAKI